MLPNEKLTETLAEQNKPTPEATTTKKLFNFRREARKDFGVEVAFTIKYVYPITLLIIIAVLLAVFYFLYQNFYLTMTQTVAVTNLKTNVLATELNQAKFDQIIKNENAKLFLSHWDNSGNLKSPFNYGSRNNYSTTTTTIIITTTTLSNTSTVPVKTTSTVPTRTSSTITITTTTSTASATVPTTTKK